MEKDEDKLPVMKNDNDSSSALTTEVVDKEKLNKESLDLVNKIIAENDVDKQKDLTYLFNANQNKKTIARMDKLNNLMDAVVDQALKRWKEKPDEMSNQDLINGLKTIQDIVERSQNQINGVNDAPAPTTLIQVNQQINNNPKDPVSTLNRDSREKVKNVVAEILKSINAPKNIIDMTTVDQDLSGKEDTIMVIMLSISITATILQDIKPGFPR